MEFFKVARVGTSEKEIQEKLTLQNLERFCESIFPLEAGIEQCLIGGMWGEFTLRRDQIMGGVRFSMLDCPNALAWTITTGYPPARDKAVVHLTINRERKQVAFVEEIHLFLADIEKGLSAYLAPNSRK